MQEVGSFFRAFFALSKLHHFRKALTARKRGDTAVSSNVLNMEKQIPHDPWMKNSFFPKFCLEGLMK